MFSTIHITSFRSSHRRLSDCISPLAVFCDSTMCEPTAKAFLLLPHFKSTDLQWFAAASQVTFPSVVGSTTLNYLYTNNFSIYMIYMYFQEKTCYDSCCVLAFIKQLLKHMYYVITGHVKALEFVFYATLFHSKQLLHFHL